MGKAFFFLNRNGQCVECTCICCLSMIFSIYAKQVMRKATNGSRNNGTFLICILERSSELFSLWMKTKNKFWEINSYNSNDIAIGTIHTVTWTQTHKWNETWVECFPVTYICVLADLMSPICIVSTQPNHVQCEGGEGALSAITIFVIIITFYCVFYVH